MVQFKKIDMELNAVKINERMKKNIKKSLCTKNQFKILKTVAASFIILLLGGTTVAAGYYAINKISVNDEVLPELNDLKVVNIKK